MQTDLIRLVGGPRVLHVLLNAACREGWCAAAPTHPPAIGLATAKPPRLRSARARREGGRATHPPGGKAGHCRAPSPPMASLPSRSSTLAFGNRMVETDDPSGGHTRRGGAPERRRRRAWVRGPPLLLPLK
jgi:hypothetical protein